MTDPNPSTTVNIRPGVSVLSVFRHLNYKPWYALAEFVDNSLQSYLTNRRALQEQDGMNISLKVDVEINPNDGGKITVRDNAAGIHWRDYQRAFKTAEPPPDATGLSQFGVGMKSAACWFGRRWSVRSSALGENVERLIEFDVDTIVRESIETLVPTIQHVNREHHFTEIVLRDLHTIPQGRTLGKMREHLESIYRLFIDDGILKLRFNEQPLSYRDPPFLQAPFFRDPAGQVEKWDKDVDVELDDGRRIHGWAALMQTASTRRAGFALFRHRRLIQGSADEGYRPERIFGLSNSFTYQRLFGELEVEGFDVTHTKDGFDWGEHEDTVIERLREQLDAEPLPLLKQAEGYRVRASQPDLSKSGETALDSTARVIEQQAASTLEDQVTTPFDDGTVEPPEDLPDATPTARRIIEVELIDDTWRIVLETTTSPAVGDWLEVASHLASENDGTDTRVVGARLALAHPFMDRFAGASPDRIEPLLRVAAALALAEEAARSAGARQVGLVRMFVNDLLRGPLSKP